MTGGVEPLQITQGTDGTEVEATELTPKDRTALADEDWIAVEETSAETIRLIAERHAGVAGLPSGRQLVITSKVDCNLLYLLAYAGQLSEEVARGADASISATGSFIDVLARLFVSELEQILQGGLHESYQRVSGDERYIRGRLDLTRQVARRGSVSTRFSCDYDELTYDVALNHALHTTCEQLFPLVTDEVIADNLQQYWDQLRSYLVADPPRLTADEVRDIDLNRLNNQYDRILTLSILILESSFLDSIGPGPHQFDRLLIDMRNLFERVVFRGFSEALERENVRVNGDGSPPERGVSRVAGSLLETVSDAESDSSQSQVQQLQPDVFVTSIERDPEFCLVGDAKWKDPDDRPSRNDLYQMTAYQSFSEAPGVLVYPDLDGRVSEQYTFQTSKGQIREDQPLYVIELSWSGVETYSGFQNAVERKIGRVINRVLD
jgi:5-methylcytosine-specific restriction enzyme subunit McrC